MKLERIIAASSNQGKIAEIKKIFKDAEIISMHDAGFEGDIEETGTTFKENAAIKAKTVGEKLKLPTIADDSGLCVDFLCGAPGIYSARFSGEGDAANRALLLERLRGAADRRAHFECAVCLYIPDGKTVFGVGRTDGHILEEERGKNGFGYDCLFYSDELKKSYHARKKRSFAQGKGAERFDVKLE